MLKIYYKSQYIYIYYTNLEILTVQNVAQLVSHYEGLNEIFIENLLMFEVEEIKTILAHKTPNMHSNPNLNSSFEARLVLGSYSLKYNVNLIRHPIWSLL